jgi:hypothetical protein
VQVHLSTSSSSASTHVRSPPELTGWWRILASTIALTAIGISCIEFCARANGNAATVVTSPSLWGRQWYRFDESANETDSPKIHFEDYIENSQYNCPEWSHLTPAAAKDYTKNIISDQSPATTQLTSHPHA